MKPTIKILEVPEEMTALEGLQNSIWVGGDVDVIPAHLLLAIAHNGGLVLGAYLNDQLVGFLVGFLGLAKQNDEYQVKHVSHALGILPDYRSQGIGFALKRAQWQMVRHQQIEQITWTFDPLMSPNAHLNITKLGAVCNQYQRDYYGNLRDGLNEGLPSDRLIVDWWLNSGRVKHRLSRKTRPQLDLAHYLAADVVIVNPSALNKDGFPLPGDASLTGIHALKDTAESIHKNISIFMIEIPANFQAIRTYSNLLALDWRMHSRLLFETAFELGYIITDFVFLPGNQPRSFYVLSKGDVTLGGEV
jgi:predicted GNAT superfamily acetyltransferase